MLSRNMQGCRPVSCNLVKYVMDLSWHAKLLIYYVPAANLNCAISTFSNSSMLTARSPNWDFPSHLTVHMHASVTVKIFLSSEYGHISTR